MSLINYPVTLLGNVNVTNWSVITLPPIYMNSYSYIAMAAPKLESGKAMLARVLEKIHLPS